MSVPNESVGLVIGRGGVTIKTMEAQAGIRIQIAKECPPETPNHRPITLVGPPHTVEHARALIQAKVENRPLPQYDGGAAAAHSYAQPYAAQAAYAPPYGYPPAAAAPAAPYGYPAAGGYGGYDYSQQQQAYYYPQAAYGAAYGYYPQHQQPQQ